jgi:DNA-binding NarL/FixJ family response regulator
MGSPQAAESTSVVLVEDEPSTQHRFASVIERGAGLALAGVGADLAEGLAEVDRRRPDILITDLGLPDGSGIELIRHTRAELPETQILVITVFADETHVVDAIAHGASGYILKDGTDDEIYRAIRDLEEGGSPMSPSIARYVLRRFQAHEQPAGAVTDDAASRGDPTALTAREKEILLYVAKGFSGPEIGRLLDRSPNTIKTHVRRIYRKLEVTSRGEAVLEAVHRGLVDADR